MSFQNLGLKPWLIDQCNILQIKKPTPIQNACIPKILKGYNCMGNAKTGSGKTAAFALPILQKFSEDPYGIYALILTPTRELAFQIADHFNILGKPLNLKTLVIVGGNDMMLQNRDFAFIPHIVISTPGRLVDHIDTYNDLSFDRIKFFVMDEADRLLAGYFNKQLSRIMSLLPAKRQNLVFSATFNEPLEQLAMTENNNAAKQLFVWKENSDIITVDTLQQFYYVTPMMYKEAYLLYICLDFLNQIVPIVEKSKLVALDHAKKIENAKGFATTFNVSGNNSLAIIFTNSCKKCQLLHAMLKKLGIHNLPIHSNLTQKQRLIALNKFKSGLVRILIATDLASRGLDIPKVDLIINHAIPKNAEDYVHRVGRTARAGRGGVAITLICPPNDIPILQNIEKHIGTQTVEYPCMDEKIVTRMLAEVALIKRECQIDLDNSNFDKRRQINELKGKILKGETLTEEERKMCSEYHPQPKNKKSSKSKGKNKRKGTKS